MRAHTIAGTLLPLLTFAISLVGAYHAPPPAPAAAPVPTLHQHRIPRDFRDTCAWVNATVIDDLHLGGALDASLATSLDLCICLSFLPELLTADVELVTLGGLLGIDNLELELTAVVNNAPGGGQCTYPQNAQAVCNQNDVCAWDCEAPYTRDGDECVCAAPMTSCNGKCGLYPKGCGSSVPQKKKRGAHSQMHKRGSVARAH
ncbi:hypothetical protein CERSUDRAFT_115438 [Gelatoporia subvermispora B]|uniref:Uncharacterized protein n=1 Tax=Ceriporiopsis subvermispora (strain B) TaxID=914234 RepID=M2PJQ5_CERS8|nr:hypothetical protein CERSUDRAFT_115438 [Gelatoporia subvermispora B]